MSAHLQPTLFLSLLFVVGCTADPLPDPDTGPIQPAARLQAASQSPIVLRGGDGSPLFLQSAVQIPANLADDPVAGADWFLDEFGSELGLEMENLEFSDAVAQGDSTSVDYVWHKDGVPLFGVDVRVIIFGDEVGAVMANLPGDLDEVSTTPNTSEEAAWNVAVPDGEGDPVSAELVLLNDGIFNAEITPTILAWKLLRDRSGRREVRFVDATAAQPHPFWFPETFDAAKIEVLRRDSCVGRDWTEDPDSEIAGYLQRVYDYFLERHRFRSYDGRDSTLTAIADYEELNFTTLRCEPRESSGWSPEFKALFVSRYTNSLDVTAHEIGHAFVRTFATLRGGEPGALNESIADAIGSFVDSSTPWTLGDGTEVGLIRNMANPSEMGDPDHYDRKVSSDDIHSNSAIPSYAVYLMTEGGSADGIDVDPIGVFLTQELIFRLVTRGLPSGATFEQARDALWTMAERWARTSGGSFTHRNCGSVLNAFAAVGIGTQDTDSDCYDDDIDTCPEVYNPEQDEMDECAECSTDYCGGSGPDFDSQCCEGMICVLGDCVADEGPREGERCMSAQCAHTLLCSKIEVLGARVCCARDDDYCQQDDDCCGNMGCVDNHCEALSVGEACVGSDCAGLAFCSRDRCRVD